jgi:signal transduction histidine kinase
MNRAFIHNGTLQDCDRYFTVVRKDGSTLVVEMNSTTLDGPNGQKTSVVCSLRDATERRRLETSMRRANQKLNLLSSITRHDILNQLTVLQGYIEMARNLSDPDDIERCISRMDLAATNINRQIAFTKEYQFIGVNAPTWSEPARIWDRVGLFQAPSGVAIKCRCSGIEVFADPLFDKVLYNLIENSLRHGGMVTEVSLTCQRVEGGLELLIEDDGVGIEPSNKFRIFEKGYGKGTGLGLFLAKEILAITEATIQEVGTFGQGARFIIFFRDGDWRPC